MGVTVTLDHIMKQFKTPGGGTMTAVDDLSLNIASGSFVTLLGPSGCGKTTTLRMIAGFEVPNSGRIFIDGADVTVVPPNRRNLAMVFQSYALFPHLTVAGNIAYGLKLRKIPPAQIQERVAAVLKTVGLDGLGERYTNQLSGGQQQRVALARAIVLEPKVLLFDEPLSNLDAKLREEMRSRIRELQQSLGTTAVYVTHDQVEAMTMSDVIVVINHGKIEQIGTPAEIYEQPASRFVADFIGRVNLLPTETIATGTDGCQVNLFGNPVKLHSFSQPAAAMLIAVRPEAVELQPDDGWNGPLLPGRLVKTVYVGQHLEYTVQLDAGPEMTAISFNRYPGLSAGDPVRIGLKPDAIHGVPA
ncbi:iron(III) transport system ATP-binding protein [Hydrogenispora ethanolica]|jgi:iron(III) transport system ATP-binding protein|uniref:Iron(III) transport system ATP-binding protein n=1 Tax=Hydrogenispora ethanolica TaxID=1082276 RepID=A0A4R1R854_HYDET|nr:ABC transporter ATP-binding protein [Hydrogenispora ethanolica]TCL61823.1 iron(III) transport system ATP-binding protein [Hydrogenispora ethanolica]